MNILRWLACLPIVVLGKLLTIVCAPVAAWLSLGRDALPAWLRWMQTHDNPIDALWQQPAHMRGYATLTGIQPIWPMRCANAAARVMTGSACWHSSCPGAGAIASAFTASSFRPSCRDSAPVSA